MSAKGMCRLIFHTVSDKNLTRGKAGYEARRVEEREREGGSTDSEKESVLQWNVISTYYIMLHVIRV